MKIGAIVFLLGVVAYIFREFVEQATIAFLRMDEYQHVRWLLVYLKLICILWSSWMLIIWLSIDFMVMVTLESDSWLMPQENYFYIYAQKIFSFKISNYVILVLELYIYTKV